MLLGLSGSLWQEAVAQRGFQIGHEVTHRSVLGFYDFGNRLRNRLSLDGLVFSLGIGMSRGRSRHEVEVTDEFGIRSGLRHNLLLKLEFAFMWGRSV